MHAESLLLRILEGFDCAIAYYMKTTNRLTTNDPMRDFFGLQSPSRLATYESGQIAWEMCVFRVLKHLLGPKDEEV
jgi:hypothetical protein